MGKWQARYVGQRNAAGATWGWDNRHGFPSPNVHVNVAQIWAMAWNAAGVELWNTWETFNPPINKDAFYNEFSRFNQAMGFESGGNPAYTFETDANGILVDPERFWGPVGKFALLLDPMSDAPTTVDNAYDVVIGTAADTATGLSKVVITTAQKASQFGADLIWAVVKPFVLPISLIAGGYYLLKLIQERNR